MLLRAIREGHHGLAVVIQVVLDQGQHALMLLWVVIHMDHDGKPIAQQGIVANVREQHLCSRAV